MTRKIMILLALHLMMNACQNNTNGSELPPYKESAAAYDMQPDSVEIRGSFTNSCEAPGAVKLREYNVMYSRFKQVPVNGKGEFSFKIYLDAPRQITMKTGKTNFDFFISTKEKVYQIEITCDAANRENIEVKGSEENAAFRSFNARNHKLKNELNAFKDNDLSDKESFRQFQDKLKSYQADIAEIARKHPSTYTAKILCATEILPEATLASVDALRKNYLNRTELSNPDFYTTFLSSRIFTIYMEFILDEKDPSFTWFEDAMKIALKDKEAAKFMQQILHDLLYYGRREELLVKYVQWFQDHSQESHNPNVQVRLQKIKKCLAGSKMTDIILNDVNQSQKKLSETVATNKLTLMAVWSPDCSHCRQEMPQLGPVWDQYRGKGLAIYAIAFDSSEEEWKSYVKSELRDWVNVYEPESNNPQTTPYVVNYTPTYVLIDQNGTILYRFLDLEGVKNQIAVRMN